MAGHLSGLGVDAHLFGGAVRDALLGRASHDLDITIDARPHEVGPRLAGRLGGTYFDLDRERGIGRVAIGAADPITVDLTGLGADETIHSHLRGRDYSVDAMAVSLEGLASGSAAVIDPTGGLIDLRAGSVRALSPGALNDDPIRLLRGPRLAAANRFELEAITAGWIRERAALIANVSPERVRDELIKILAAPSVSSSIRGLDALGLLTAVLPELEESRGVAQPPEHHYDVLDHLMETPGALEMLLVGNDDVPALRFVPRFDGLTDYFGRPLADDASRSTLLRLACLLHDVAKPATKTIEDTGRIRFFGHGPEGAAVCKSVMSRLRFSRKATQYVATIVEYHLRPGQAAPPAKEPSTRAIYRYRRDLGDVSIDTLYLNMADYMAAKGPAMLEPGYDLGEWERHCGAIACLLDGDDGQGRDGKPADRRLLDGVEIMAELSLEAGPAVGELLEMVEEARATGEIDNRAEAVALARKALETGRVTRGRGLPNP